MTKEDLIKQGYTIAGTEPERSFVISIVSDRKAERNINMVDKIQDLLNRKLNLSNYTNGAIENITITSLRPYNGEGVNWLERKVYKRKQKKLIIDIIFEKYYQFCEANKLEALKLIAEQTINATEKYMPKIKEIDYQSFHKDLIILLRIENLISEIKK